MNTTFGLDGQSRPRPPRIFASILLLIGLGALSKETAVAVAGVLLLTDLYFHDDGAPWEGVVKNWRLYVPLLVGGAAGGLFVYRLASREGTAGSSLSFSPRLG